MEKHALSIGEFCRDNGGISRATFYNLLRRGDGPRIMKVGSRTLISAAAAAAWQQRMEKAIEINSSSSRGGR